MMVLGERQIHLWLAFCDDVVDQALLDGYRAMMSASERACELRFQFERDRKSYLVTRALVRTVLSRYVEIEPDRWRFGSNDYGRPHILNEEVLGTGVDFNIAHSHGLIAMAVSAHRVIGVDVENTRQRRVSLEIAQRYFAADEVAALALLPQGQRQDRFFELWTLKESYIKARGMGLSIPLDQFSFHFPREGAVEIRIQPGLADDPARWQFWQFAAAPDQLVALAAERRAAGPTESELTVTRVIPNRTQHALRPPYLRS